MQESGGIKLHLAGLAVQAENLLAGFSEVFPEATFPAMLAARLGTLLTDVIPDESRGAFFSQLAPRMRPLSVAEGDYVIRQGDVNDDGTVNVLDLLKVIEEWGICD